MAELPELETLRRELEKEAVGKRFKTPEVTGTKVVRHNGSKKAFQAPPRGRQGEVGRPQGPAPRRQPRQRRAPRHRPRRRRAASRRWPPSRRPPKGTAVVFTFTQGGQIRLVDPAGGAEAFVVASRRARRRGARDRGRRASTPWPTPCRGPRSPGCSWPAPPSSRPSSWTPRWSPASARSTATRSSGRPGCATTARPTRCPRRRSGACSGPSSRRSTRPSSTAAPPSTSTRSSTSTASPATTRTSSRCTPGRASRAVAAGPRSPRPALEQAPLLLRGLPGLTVVREGARGRSGDH